MSPGLRQYPLAGVDQYDSQFRVGRAGRHIARVLLVPGCIGHHEPAFIRCEVAPGHVDGNALLALRRQTVDQQGKVDFVALGTLAPAVRLQGGELIFEYEFGIVQQPPDERALAVVDAAAGQKAQRRLVRLFIEPGLEVVGRTLRHQK